nr:unnamed protein product [Digitaria exilis]
MEAVVVDAGSKLLKAGIAAPDQSPPLVMPSKMKLEVEDQELADGAVVEEVVQPVVRGFVKDWDAMEDLLNYVLYRNVGWEIGDEGQILFTEPLFTPKTLREQLVQLMFEKFNVSGFYASEQAVLSLYAVGRISGCTVDIGHGKIGFEDRFQREANLSASAICPSLVKPPEYMPENLARYSAWMGGAILAKVVFPQNQHVTKGEYDETGPSIVHKKCF